MTTRGPVTLRRLLVLDLGPAISERHRSVEHQRSPLPLRARVCRIADEIPRSLELVARAKRIRYHTRLDLRPADRDQRFGIQRAEKILSLFHGIRIGDR